MKPARGRYAKVAVTMIVGCALGCGTDPEQTSSASAGNGGTDTTSSAAGGAGSGGAMASGAAGVGGGQSGASGTMTASGGAGPGGAGPGGGGAGGSSTSNGGSGGSGAVQPIPTCTPACQTTADCPGAANDYTCVAGACEFQGCQSDAQCEETLGAGYACQEDSGFATPFCVDACQTSADCSQEPAYNETCVGGACKFGGCTTNAGCVQTLGAGYVCQVDSGYDVPLCVQACQTTADCDQGSAAYDADNYKCIAGGCKFLGCHSDAECVETFGADYVCH